MHEDDECYETAEILIEAKLAISRKESRELLYWLRLIGAKRLLDPNSIADDISEARQLTAILRAIIMKARSSPRRG